jgi:outer membrane protein assembly factor BamB
MKYSLLRVTIIGFVLCAVVAGASAGDWPMWRYDAQRRAVSPDGLAQELHLQWHLQLPEPMRAWPFQWDDAGKLDFDVSYEPVVSGSTLVIGSNVSDSITAYSTHTGDELWRFYTNGPVRMAPVLWEGRVYAGSDDGYVYCLDLADGGLIWRFHAAPRERLLLGNARMVSTWAVRGGPVIRDGTLYFAAGVFPFMGTFMYALDARSGDLQWVNSGTGSMYNLHQHNGAFAFGGVAPQGYMVATEERLLIPGGRSAPAVYDRATGDFVYFQQATGTIGKGAGGYGAWAQGEWFFNPNEVFRSMYALQDGAQYGDVPSDIVSDEHLVGIYKGELVGHSPEPKVLEVEITDRLGRGAIKEKYELIQLFASKLPVELDRIYLQAGPRVYAGGADGLVAAIDIPGADDAEAEVTWQTRVDGTPWSMMAADDRLFVTTEEGAVYCFGPDAVAQAVTHSSPAVAPDRPQDAWTQRAGAMLDATGREGFALVLGAGSGRLVHELLAQSQLHVLVVEPDAARAEQARRLFDAAGYYGRRMAVIHADPATVELPPYFAALITAEDLSALAIEPVADGSWERLARRVYEMLRPYGGAICMTLGTDEHDALSYWARSSGVVGAQASREGAMTVVARQGPLPGAGQWTHQYADAANTGLSHDDLTRAPMGLLWYGGGYNNHQTLPRHENGPVPQVIGGRLFILGKDTLSARDVYTGRKLWVKDLPTIGYPFTSLQHEEEIEAGGHPYFPSKHGANFIGSNYVSVADSIYVCYEGRCLRLDPATGETLAEFRVPGPDGADGEMSFGFVVLDDILVTGVAPQMFDDTLPGDDKSWNATSSERVVAIDRYSGQLLWARDAAIGFRHNTIIASGGKVFLIDGLPETQLEMLQRRGEVADQPARVMALDARTGELLWAQEAGTFGTWLSYSQERDILIQSGRHGARVPPADEPRERMIAHSAGTGEILWERSERYSGPIALHGDRMITGRGQPAIDLLTGGNVMREHPLTGLQVPWSFNRSYGCGTQNASQHLLTFRSGAAGYYDLENDGGTGNFGGTKAGCTNSMVVADGLLNCPEYTRSCFCSYQLQTSYALVHEPEAEMWTYTNLERGAGIVRRAGINLGAPGCRLDGSGTWWLEYPSSGASALELPIEMADLSDDRWQPRPFVHHSSWVQDAGSSTRWISASGLEGAVALKLQMADEEDIGDPVTYTVRLHFIEPGQAAVGQRQFSISLQGSEVISGLDVAQRAGGPRQALVQQVTGVEVAGELLVSLQPDAAAQFAPVLCGIEMILEDGTGQTALGGADDSYRWAAPGAQRLTAQAQ